jgi:hypothetical protein
MTRLVLDFAGPSHRPSLPGLVLLVVGLFVAGWVAYRYQSADTANSELAQRLAAAHRTSEAEHRRKPDPAQETRTKSDDEARQRLTLAWPRLLATLEHARGKDVGFIQIDADGRRGSAILKAEARDYRAMLDFYQRLQSAHEFGEVFLAEHELKDVDGTHPVGFTMRMTWKRS